MFPANNREPVFFVQKRANAIFCEKHIMVKKAELVKGLLDIANEFDALGNYKFANALTRMAQDFVSEPNEDPFAEEGAEFPNDNKNLDDYRRWQEKMQRALYNPDDSTDVSDDELQKYIDQVMDEIAMGDKEQDKPPFPDEFTESF